MKKMLMMIGAAAVAVSANADTYTDANNITWTYVANSDGENTVTLGNGSACISTSASVDAAEIPWTFEKDGVAYTVTQIGAGAFAGALPYYALVRNHDGQSAVSDDLGVYGFEHVLYLRYPELE